MKRVAEMGDHFYYKRPVETTGGVAAILVEGQEPTKGRHLPTDPPGGGIAPSRPVRPRPPVDPGYGDGKDGPDTTEGTRLVTKEGGDKTAKERRVRTKVPRPRWQPANEMTDGWVMAQFVPTKYEVYLNEEHPVYREMLDYVKKHWLVTAEQSVRAVRQAFASSAISKVAHVLHSRAIFSSTSEGVKKTTKDIVDAALSEEALSMALMGWHDIYNGVEKQLRHKGSK